MEDVTASAEPLSVAIIIIGDEILKGHVQDTNSHFLCKELWQLGAKVKKIVVVRDDIDDIASAVREASPNNDVVITTGGVGPTHDDITMEAIGKAFSEEIAPHQDVLKVLFSGSKSSADNPWRKMALVPTSTKIHLVEDGGKFTFILFIVHNVHSYPGVPSLMRKIFNNSKDLYRGQGSKFYLKELFFSCGEGALARPLTDVQNAFPSVQLGSYPNDSYTSHQVKVMMESSDVSRLEEAYSNLVLTLPPTVLMSCKKNYGDATLSKQVAEELSLTQAKASVLPDFLCRKILDSLTVLKKGLENYGNEAMSVCFNGGKDCTVILALLRAILNKKGLLSSKIKVVYVVESEQFSEVKAFIKQAAKHFSLEVITVYGSIKESLLKLQESHPSLKAMCMGTRRTDPHTDGLEAFSMTESSWPEYMRINCILDWTYRDVWLFLRLCEVPYCKLYDQGYTSLDGMADTHPNPSLLVSPEPSSSSSDSSSNKTYLPAFMLKDEGLERMGRTKSSNL